MVVLDSLDKRLIELLEEDARQSSEVLAKKLGVSPVTVRRRIRKLIKQGVMYFSAIVDPGKVGLHLSAIIALNVVLDKLDSVVHTLSDMPEIKWFSTTTGRFDILAFAQFPSTEELARFVQSKVVKIEGVKDSETFICLQMERKRS